MPTTVQVNGTTNTLVHKMSTGTSVATLPDVCKTPSPAGPVPIPYPNIAQSITLASGTTNVKGDKAMAANKGSKFALSNGDNAGVAGGVKSSTFMKEATWILYSFDVKLQKKNAARLSDKMFHNAENSANLGGEIQGVATANFVERIGDKAVADELCDAACHARKNYKPPAPPNPNRQQLMAERLSGGSFTTHAGRFTAYIPKAGSKILCEVPTLTPLTFGSSLLPLVSMSGRVIAGTAALAGMAPGMAIWGGPAAGAAALGGALTVWDAVILKNPAAGFVSSNISKFVEVKFPGDSLTRNQRIARLSMNDEDWAKKVEMDPENDCTCNS